MTGLHPVRQLVWHLHARQPLLAPSWLSPSEASLFDRMAPADQLEGLAVSRTLAELGYGQDRDLLVAALLHDVGKSLAPAFVGYRVALTLLDTLVPWLPRRLPGPLGTLSRHAALGADMAGRAGLGNGVVGLIADHHSRTSDARLLALQKADGLH